MSEQRQEDVMVKPKINIKPMHDLAEPPMYKIILLNDDVTTVDFVVDC